jgi:hypothetical protein
MRCDQCRHWDAEEGKRKFAKGVGLCTKAKPFWDVSEWNDDGDDMESWGRVLKPEFADQLMFVQDGSDYKAYLVTRPDFFCAHYVSA